MAEFSARRSQHLRADRVARAGTGPRRSRLRLRRRPATCPLAGGPNLAASSSRRPRPARLYVLDGADLSTGNYPDPRRLARQPDRRQHDRRVGLHGAHHLHVGLRAARRHQRRRDALRRNCPTGTPNSGETIISMLPTPGQSTRRDGGVVRAQRRRRPHELPAHLHDHRRQRRRRHGLVHCSNGTQLDGRRRRHRRQRVSRRPAPPATTVPSMSFPIAVKNRIVVVGARAPLLVVARWQ